MNLVYARTGQTDPMGYPVFLIGKTGDLVRWSPETAPEAATLLGVMAENRCWVDLTSLAPPGSDPTAAQDAIQKRLNRLRKSIAAVDPDVAEALAFRTRVLDGRVFGRCISEERIDTRLPADVGSMSETCRQVLHFERPAPA
jgi:hypothetical protein